MPRYDWKCDCGSVFMTEGLLNSHKSGNNCKPNAVYTLDVRVDSSKRLLKKAPPKKEVCSTCGGKGYTRSRPCPRRCYYETETPFERFVQDQWRITDQCLFGRTDTHQRPEKS